MTEEVYTPCPDCGVEIPFYETVDELKECPECATSSERLFELAIREADDRDLKPAAPGLNVVTGGEA